MKRKLALLLVLALICSATNVFAGQIEEMINDLGGPNNWKNNNGKVQACAEKGTKKITIKKYKGGGADYDAIYKNCIENGRRRDGTYHLERG